jgi:hypothetical protein
LEGDLQAGRQYQVEDNQMRNVFCIGVDLGQSNDHTALAVVEKVHSGNSHKLAALHLRHLERYPLRTPYPQIADAVAALVKSEHLVTHTTDEMLNKITLYPELVVDQTGVGPPVTSLLRERGLTLRSVVVTASDGAGSGRGGYRVPKRDLVSALEVSLQTGMLQVAEGLRLWGLLREEMLDLRRKVDLKTTHDALEHWREGKTDDLVLAVCFACWGASRNPRGFAGTFSYTTGGRIA